MISLAMAAPLLKRFLPYIAGLALVLGAIWWFRHQLQEADEAGYQRATAEFREQLRVSAEEGRKAVQQARDEAEQANARQRAEQQAKYEQARTEHQQALSEAQHRTVEWQRRYQKALSTDSSCAAWAQEQIRCPI